jgi:cysteinyl-tRNA synthetase
MRDLTLYNTLGREKQRFEPLEAEKASVYACGPTVYDYAHLGNLRNYVFNDILHRVLRRAGYDVDFVINITDVGHLTDDADQGEDKMEKKSKEEDKDIWELARYYEDVFKSDLQSLHILDADVWPRATEHIQEQIDLVKAIEDNGYTYETSDGVYFDTDSLDAYGELIPDFDPEDLDEGHRVDMKEKRSPTDFALWKLSGDRDRKMEWDSPWGVGFPGWHVECTAMGCAYLGETFDIHTGGIDHIPVHHTNELAQARGAYGDRHADYWLHGEFLNLEDGKMSKSKGDFLRLASLDDNGFDPLDFRYLCLLTHYRKPLTFSWDALESARNARLSIERRVRDIVGNGVGPGASIDAYVDAFDDAVFDDLNVAEGLGVVHDVLDSDADDADILATLYDFDEVLGLGLRDVSSHDIPDRIWSLAERREELREQEEFDEADELREEIRSAGYVVEDEEDGFRIRPRRQSQGR